MPRAKTTSEPGAGREKAPKLKGLRTVAPTENDRVSLTLDGKTISARRGEPIAASLVAAGILGLARSPKFHRPRGPSCFRAACDGCLARIDGVPNLMTCRIPAKDGMVVESQNTLGSRTIDLLSMTDWFFPEGMNHHELFAGVPGIQPLMQTFARRVAGLGHLPNSTNEENAPIVRREAPARRRTVDVLVIGSGPAGMGAALALADSDRVVEVVDDAIAPGGSLAALGSATGTLAAPWSSLRRVFDEAVARGIITLRLETTAAAIYGRDVLVVGTGMPGAGAVGNDGAAIGAEILEARTLVIASGAHDGIVPFEGNDVPGVMSARAGGWLLARGILPGKRVVVCVPPEGGPFGDAFVEAARALGLGAEGSAMQVTKIDGVPKRAHGVSRLRKVDLTDSTNGQMSLPADILLVDAPRAPAYELCEQVGAKLAHTPNGYVVRADHGKIAPGVYAVGEVAGTPLDHAAMSAAIEALLHSVLSERKATA